MGKREKKEKKSAKSDVMEVEELAEVKIKKSKRVRSKKRKEEDEDDDVEANEDLSLKIVEKALLRGCSTKNGEVVVVTDLKKEKKEKDKKKKKKKEKNVEIPEDPVSSGIDKGFQSFCSDMSMVGGMKEEENVVSIDMNVVDNAAEKNPVEMSNGVVLRRLLVS
uniref:Cellular nucleic acid binding protein n=1 Tax=Solanum tuberosum TaxID=4113 RepID=M0ZTG8_SOLTU